MTTNVLPVTGLEYTLVPDGTPTGAEIGGPNSAYPYPGSQTPYSWTGVTIGYDSSSALNNYLIQTRYKVVTFVPAVPANAGDPDAVPPVPANAGSDASYTFTYPSFHIVSQVLTCTSHSVATPGNPFETELGDEYTSTSNAIYGVGSTQITNGMKYDYAKVFDQSEIAYVAPLAPYNATPTEQKRVPTTPYDPDADPPTYPTNTVTSFAPDPRQSVTVTYSLTTVWNFNLNSGAANYNDADFTETISLDQVVTQDLSNLVTIIKRMISRSYYDHNLTPWKPDDRDPPRPSPGITVDGAPYYPGAT